MSRPSIRTLIAVAVAALLVGGLTAVVTPAGAALKTNWSKIFTKEIKPRADKRYAPKPKLIRGAFAVSDADGVADEILLASISYGYQVTPAPVAHYIPAAGPVPAGCSGSWQNPNAKPGHLCVFEAFRDNATINGVFGPSGASTQSTVGAVVAAKPIANGYMAVAGSWAVRPRKVSGDRVPLPAKVGAPAAGAFGG